MKHRSWYTAFQEAKRLYKETGAEHTALPDNSIMEGIPQPWVKGSLSMTSQGVIPVIAEQK
jgi:hypothetical protein